MADEPKKLTELPVATAIQPGDVMYLVQGGASKQVTKQAQDAAVIRTVTTTAVITSADEVLRCNGTFNVTLPAATGSGDMFLVKNVGSGTITILPAGANTIDGGASYTLPALERTMVLDGVAGNWDAM